MENILKINLKIINTENVRSILVITKGMTYKIFHYPEFIQTVVPLIGSVFLKSAKYDHNEQNIKYFRNYPSYLNDYFV